MPRGGWRPGAGRPKGSRNKGTDLLEDRLNRLGCDPLRAMAELAMDPTVPVAVRAKLYAELASFLYPKRKAVDTGLSPEDGISISLNLGGD
jgi:hypothetical protein